jgi:hypothetical protein
MNHPNQVELKTLSIGQKFYQLNKIGTPKYSGADCIIYHIQTNFIEFLNLKTNKIITVSKNDKRFVVLIN